MLCPAIIAGVGVALALSLNEYMLAATPEFLSAPICSHFNKTHC